MFHCQLGHCLWNAVWDFITLFTYMELCYEGVFFVFIKFLFKEQCFLRIFEVFFQSTFCYVYKTQFDKNSTLHCVKSVLIRRFSGPYFPAFGLNTDTFHIVLFVFIRRSESTIFEKSLINGRKCYLTY